MRTLSMRRRYERTLPVLMAIVVASAVTVGVALLVLPNGDGEGHGGSIDPALPAAAAIVATPIATDQAVPATSTPSPTEPSQAAGPTVPVATPTARGIRRPSPTSSPSPTHPPEVGENLVVNGGFNDELNHWYSENETAVVAGAGRRGGPAVRLGTGGGYADQQLAVVAGRTYRLQAWGRVSTPGDSGVVGISYFDAAGNRLASEEPPPLQVDQTALTRESLNFSPPANAAAVRVYFWKRAGTAELFVDDVSVREYLIDVNLTPTS
ncbi:MAG TPA: hypothetical protein VH482_07040 [Thermomicrobiales bacterium]